MIPPFSRRPAWNQCDWQLVNGFESSFSQRKSIFSPVYRSERARSRLLTNELFQELVDSFVCGLGENSLKTLMNHWYILIEKKTKLFSQNWLNLDEALINFDENLTLIVIDYFKSFLSETSLLQQWFVDDLLEVAKLFSSDQFFQKFLVIIWNSLSVLIGSESENILRITFL